MKYLLMICMLFTFGCSKSLPIKEGKCYTDVNVYPDYPAYFKISKIYTSNNNQNIVEYGLVSTQFQAVEDNKTFKNFDSLDLIEISCLEFEVARLSVLFNNLKALIKPKK